MAAKDDTLKTLTALKGIGKVKAEAIIDAGFDTVKKIQDATIEELCTVNGVSESVASSIKEQLGASEQSVEKPMKKEEKKPAEKPKQVQKVEKKEPAAPKKKATKSTSTDAPDEYVVKKKPVLSKEKSHDLHLRKEKKLKTPEFLREEWFRYKRIPQNWRRPDGITSKMRINKKYRPARVRVGFRGPKKVRGLHPSGFEEIIVYNVSDLEHINADTQAARIGSSVGTRKRVAIAEKAKKLDIRLLNK